MAQWHSDGRPLDDEGLGDVAAHERDILCECAGTMFRFTAETVQARHPAESRGETVVLTLRQLGASDPARAVHLVDFASTDLFGAAACGDDCLSFDEASKTASRAARRYAGLELFRRAQELIAGKRAA
jgi:hypothetical protein